MTRHVSAFAALFIASPFAVGAQDLEEKQQLDEIVVEGRTTSAEFAGIEPALEFLVDTSEGLKNIPGAHVNGNGAITGIAQYRGMYGDRVAVSIDEHGVFSGGPNAMDAPLSYSSPMITEELVVERGIASVSSAAESIGGHVRTRLDRGSFGDADFGVSGFIGSRYSDTNNASTSAARLTVANTSHRFSVLAELDSSDNVATPAGEIHPSMIDRERFDLSYAFADGNNHFAIFAGQLNTSDSGTPALPMDIRSIDTDLYGGHFEYELTPALSIDGRASFTDVDHIMDNFALRSAPPAMMQRQNHARGTAQAFDFQMVIDFDQSQIRVGIDAALADHDARITNPNNIAFAVDNFVDVERNLRSIFGEWLLDQDSSSWEFGLRLKNVDTFAGNVGVTGVMNPGMGLLADTFNAQDRDLSFSDVDAVVKYRLEAGNNVEWRFEAAQKTRAPSYQELYLWLPLQATGGLADGRTYVGDLSLNSEQSREINIGLFSGGDRLSLSPQVFYKKIDDYIQGAPSTNPMANMVSTMMSGQTALQYTNVDAELYGVDLAWKFVLTERLALDGIASYVRGKRTDVSDNLYRLAPLNGNIGLTYAANNWMFATRLVASSRAGEVSRFNGEQETAGYTKLDLTAAWYPIAALRLEAKVDNLFDTAYQEHTAGINRVANSDIPVGARLYGQERTISGGFILSF